jgi:hypothetical protein
VRASACTHARRSHQRRGHSARAVAQQHRLLLLLLLLLNVDAPGGAGRMAFVAWSAASVVRCSLLHAA